MKILNTLRLNLRCDWCRHWAAGCDWSACRHLCQGKLCLPAHDTELGELVIRRRTECNRDVSAVSAWPGLAPGAGWVRAN